MSHVLIIGEGEIECPFCDPTGKKGTVKDGVSIEVDGTEQTVCWKHLQALVRSRANAARPKTEPATPLFARGNGVEV